MNSQEQFWKDEYATRYIEKNRTFDDDQSLAAWTDMLRKASGVETILECGCNIGRNIGILDRLLPKAQKSIIEISQPAFDIVTRRYALKHAFRGAILESGFTEQFDLVYTMGVLIHIHPDELLRTMNKMFAYSRRYILFGEYFNRTPVMLEYQGQLNKLFKRDFGRYFIENHNVRLVDYGFLWGYIYDTAGFDDITWWLFEKSDHRS